MLIYISSAHRVMWKEVELNTIASPSFLDLSHHHSLVQGCFTLGHTKQHVLWLTCKSLHPELHMIMGQCVCLHWCLPSLSHMLPSKTKGSTPTLCCCHCSNLTNLSTFIDLLLHVAHHILWDNVSGLVGFVQASLVKGALFGKGNISCLNLDKSL